MPNQYPEGSFDADAPAALSQSVLDEFSAAGISYETAVKSRAEHGRDWWPLSIGVVASGKVPHWPGVVVYPTSTEQVSAVVRIANEHKVSVTAQGGRSGVLSAPSVK